MTMHCCIHRPNIAHPAEAALPGTKGAALALVGVRLPMLSMLRRSPATPFSLLAHDDACGEWQPIRSPDAQVLKAQIIGHCMVLEQ